MRNSNMECAQAMRIGWTAWAWCDKRADFDGAREPFAYGCAACVGGDTSFVAGGTSLADKGIRFGGACRSFVCAPSSCCGPSTSDVSMFTSFVDGAAHDVDAHTYDHDSFGSNVWASI